MTEVSKRIYDSIQKSGYSYGELSHLTNIPKASIQKYATGETEKVPLDRLQALAKATNVSAAYLMGWEEQNEQTQNADTFYRYGLKPITRRRYRVLGKIACGEPIFANEDYDMYVDSTIDIDADFCLIAQGDSMIGARIKDGDIVFIKSQDIVDNGQIAAVVIEDEATLKRFYYYPNEDKMVLLAENSKYAPQVYLNEQLDRVKVLGRAVAFQSIIN